MWSWLEVYPQHVFRNAAGEKEQMSVGVAQNAVGNRLGSMSEPGARGRSFHGGRQASEPDAVLHGYNLSEQCGRALKEDPRVVFITGWNEWIAGRFDEFNGIRAPPMFVDQFDQEHSRDIEPIRGGHGDNYYYQTVDFIRSYKGVRQIPPVSPRPIQIDGRFEDALGPARVSRYDRRPRAEESSGLGHCRAMRQYDGTQRSGRSKSEFRRKERLLLCSHARPDHAVDRSKLDDVADRRRS